MRSKKTFYLLIIVAFLLYVVEWFVNSVYIRILAGSVTILAIVCLRLKTGDDTLS